jgi:hypothetical protein
MVTMRVGLKPWFSSVLGVVAEAALIFGMSTCGNNHSRGDERCQTTVCFKLTARISNLMSDQGVMIDSGITAHQR